jgi:hypothetical protein
MLNTIIRQPIIIKNVELKGSQFLARERMIKAKKLRGGPGMMGNIEPAMPAKAIPGVLAR